MGFSFSNLFGGAANETGGQSANPGSPVTGGVPLSSLGNALQGDPAAAQAQLNQLMQTAFTQGNHINDMLQREKAQSEAYFNPMRAMFSHMYGTGGIQPAAAPGVPGSSPLKTGGA